MALTWGQTQVSVLWHECNSGCSIFWCDQPPVIGWQVDVVRLPVVLRSKTSSSPRPEPGRPG